MNYADSEKINMILMSAGMRKVIDPTKADIIILNTCSVRQKWEDRVFGMIQQIRKYHKQNGTPIPLFGITGCMVRKSGLARKYIEKMQDEVSRIKWGAKQITRISQSDLLNYDDNLFIRSPHIDFVFRIEEVSFLTKILSHIYGKSIGNDAKFDDYLKAKQLRENPHSATIIIQTGCDNYCTFCIVPYTRGHENSREIEDIVSEAKEAVKNGAKEITLVGQNVNSYGKQFVDKKLWNEEKSCWNTRLKIGIDVDDTLQQVWSLEILKKYNKKYNKNIQYEDIQSPDSAENENLKQEFFDFWYKNYENPQACPLFEGAKEVIENLRKKHDLYIISSRENDTRDSKVIEKTQHFLEKIFWKHTFKGYFFTGEENNSDDKSEIANKHNFDIVIDDAPHHLQRYVQNTNAKVFCFSQPWNTDLEIENVTKIQNWKEFWEHIENIWKSPFRKLLEALDTIEGLDRIRFTSSNPHDMTEDILDAHFDLKKTCNYLHFALQSGNDAMLKKMNRRHKYTDFKKIVDYLRERDPSFSISTDIIVGYSGETDEMFADTVKAFDECEFDFVFNARYSVRNGTIASKIYEDDIPDQVKAQRWHTLNDKLLESVIQRNKKMLGKVEEVLITGKKDGEFFGRTRNFKEVYFKCDEENTKIWDIKKVQLQEVDRYIIRGSLA